jgi:hypothetical protein
VVLKLSRVFFFKHLNTQKALKISSLSTNLLKFKEKERKSENDGKIRQTKKASLDHDIELGKIFHKTLKQIWPCERW